MEDLKKFLAEYIRISKYSFVVYFVLWNITMFVMWEFVTPFKWVIDIPNMNPVDRFILVFVWFCYVATKGLIANESMLKKKRDEK